MKDFENELYQIQEQANIVLAAIHVFGYAVEFLNYMSGISDESELGVIGNNISNGMECLIDYQRRVISRVEELSKKAENFQVQEKP